MLDVPRLGTLILCATLLSAAFTIALSFAAAGKRPHLLPSVRFSTFATIALVACAVFLLAYAFQAHDFRIRYVARYSDRSMSPIYLWTALWGGQDGSLLWWSFLLSGYTGAFTWWVKDKYRELQPVMFSVLMTILAFFMVLMLFAANPFATTHGAPPADGEGLNPLLQNYWMVIHPPSLYMGLTGWSVPFAFVAAALVTGRLNEEWIHAARKWVLFAYAFLTFGNMLGMFWSYEELGWGGYWAWDPVENASFLPWLVATAYVHSVMIQERRGILKVWNVTLLSGTFILTIFGTFLTRSGLIASVHSFARSDIGNYFVGFLILLIAFVFGLVGWRMIDLRAGQRFTAVAAVVAVGVGVLVAGTLLVVGTQMTWWQYGIVFLAPLTVLGMLKCIEIVRLHPRIGAAVGAVLAGSFALAMLLYAVWSALGDGSEIWQWSLFLAFAAYAIFAGVRPLIGHRPPLSTETPRGIESLLSREFAFLFNNWILLAMMVFVLIATTFPLLSEWIRNQTVTVGPDYYNQWMVPMGLILLFLCGVGPLISWRKATGLNLLRAFIVPTGVGFVVFAVHLFLGRWMNFAPFVEWAEIYDTPTGAVLAAIYSVAPIATSTLCAFVFACVGQEFVRGTMVRMKSTGEPVPIAFIQLVAKARRRYGGYIVHLGVVVGFIGFCGSAYDQEAERSLRPGQTMEVAGYTFRFDRIREEADANKQMVFGDMTVLLDGDVITHVSPAKFIYRTHPEMPTTEVDIESRLREDLYTIMATADPEEGRATFRVIVRPLVIWIWIGGGIFLLGIFIAIFPKLSEVLAPVERSSPVRAAAAATALLLLVGALFGPSIANAQDNAGSSSLHAGTVEIHDPTERRLFERLLCECGDCQRLPLDSCACSFAEGMRAELRGKLARGDEVNDIVADYRDRFGPQSIAIPSDHGLERALWLVPVVGIFVAAGVIVWRARAWARAGRAKADEDAAQPAQPPGAYDDKLEAELRSIDED
jgi:cytochrome c-type biogenesis protein CcmF